MRLATIAALLTLACTTPPDHVHLQTPDALEPDAAPSLDAPSLVDAMLVDALAPDAITGADPLTIERACSIAAELRCIHNAFSCYTDEITTKEACLVHHDGMDPPLMSLLVWCAYDVGRCDRDPALCAPGLFCKLVPGGGGW